MQQSALPTAGDLAGLVTYLWDNPYLFISSSTVMTSGLILGAVLVAASPLRAHVLRRAAPSLAVLLAYFGIGSFALSVEIILRFHTLMPHETEVQLVSGIGHLVEALAGIAVLLPFLRGRDTRSWLWAHTIALAYWTFQVTMLTPPWFAFQGQGALITSAALGMLACAAGVNAALWRVLRR